MTDFLQVLPNLSIGVIAIVSLVYLVKYFTDKADATHERHIGQIDQRDARMREFEKEVRVTTMSQLNENTRLFQQIVNHLNAPR